MQIQKQVEEERQQRAANGQNVPLPRGDLRRLGRTNRITRQMVTTVVSTKPEDAEYKVGPAEDVGERASLSFIWSNVAADSIAHQVAMIVVSNKPEDAEYKVGPGEDVVVRASLSFI